MSRPRPFRLLPALALALATPIMLLSAGPALADPETICGRVDAVTATDATVDGRLIPLAGLDADAVAALQLALNGGLDACVEVDSTGGTVNSASAVSVSADLCGHVRPAPGTDVMVDGVIIPPDLLDAETYDTLQFIRSNNGSACLSIDVSGIGGVSTVAVQFDAEICATVTDVGAGSIELNGTSFDVASGVDLDAVVGDGICVAVTSAAGREVEITQRTDDDEDGGSSGGGGGNDGGSGSGGGEVPDTAMAPPVSRAPAPAPR
jgi:hypothetical protein